MHYTAQFALWSSTLLLICTAEAAQAAAVAAAAMDVTAAATMGIGTAAALAGMTHPLAGLTVSVEEEAGTAAGGTGAGTAAVGGSAGVMKPRC